ncbi:response regulator [Bacillus sp. FJAT-49711]|uniref:hybrid sensor histidine kinase/response regulator n=1 Tax=Bacillus sp. FJAT-49711 TaxID=2833585 RepID=UPI001BC996F5|nr:ATP-binding protein [Bacillus sp. FJAT-49711]MBS4219172.1 response regulator [Bacillus sp. FJAT-49711]
MKKKIESIIITFTIFIAICAVLYVVFTYQTKQPPEAEKGYLDLTSWNFSTDHVLPLNGEWEFYPKQLLTPGNVKNTTPKHIRVPGNFNDKMPAFGVATYRLQIKVNDVEQVYGMKISSIQLSNRIMINGKTIGESGNPAIKENYVAKNKPYTSYFNLQPGWNEIIVQVGNYELPGGGGIIGSIYLGYADQITALNNKALAHDWIILSSFLIMGLYFIGLYSQRKEDLSLIIFGLVCIFTGLYTAASGERVIFDIFPDVPFWLHYRIQILSSYLTGMGLLLFVYTAFRPYCSKRFVYIGLMVGAAMGIATIGFLTHLPTGIFLPITSIYITLSLLYVTYVFVLAALHKIAGSVYLAIAAVSLSAYALIQTAYSYFAVSVYSVLPFEPFLFLIMLALLMSLRFSNAYKKIQELSVQLIKADKLKDDFLARTSHEFKSPLHGIMNISKSVLGDSVHPLTIEHRERLQLITNITERLSQLVYDILDFSKLKEGELSIYLEPVDVRSTIDVNLRIYSYVATGRNIQLENKFPEKIPFALADKSRLGQIISNLLDNAIKHTKNGLVEVLGEVRDDMIFMSVRDTGAGIAEEELPYIFEPFRSLESSSERQVGIGLGLSIVKQLIELQNGTISVSSIQGKGTTFTISMPIAKEGEKQSASKKRFVKGIKQPEYMFPTPYYLKQNGKYTVLVADDNFSNLKILIDTLQMIDCNVIAVKNGYEVMEEINKPIAIDLVILDLMMPGMSGYEVCQEIRKKYSLTEFPVLMVTAAIQPKDKIAAFEAGANDFLPKPFDLDELKARIGSLLAMKDSFSKALNLELAFLQSQIKPHFLYNALNGIVASSYTDADRSRKLTINLAEYLRGSFQFSNIQKRVPFNQELKLIRSYVEIEKARFRDRIQVEYHIDDDLNNIKMPPLLIQPLVENAIRHGIGKKLEGGKVKITAYTADGHYCIEVEDNGVGMTSEQMAILDDDVDERVGVGLKNIKRRMKYEYGAELDVWSVQEEGTKITVRIPCELV